MNAGQFGRFGVAMANRPLLFLADEPTGELDSATTRQIAVLFRYLVEKEGLTILLTTHNPILVEYADKVFYLKDGRLSDN